MSDVHQSLVWQNHTDLLRAAEILGIEDDPYIEPLPAVPDAWQASGAYEGLIARGNFRISAAWTEGALTELTVQARSGGECRLKVPGVAGMVVYDEAGKAVDFEVNNAV